ncbi:predicted protein [Sclerotinia sclerotiorum 1980 UF-70]|uniref:Uncharacterized protein n=1 Tax=Sclerotinia sclerotiorum (strain ATCC 18683 / 1980 / Ss-1) TaxID=665079 RepID=A7F8P3_SCLS1|nr:predicted protein [Sclerotinia sclerotiorum 1980 UF-70]EDN99114.1 predicted protein [Sclerotinia sclerotiorum 1980 UF-70]
MVTVSFNIWCSNALNGNSSLVVISKEKNVREKDNEMKRKGESSQQTDKNLFM